MADNKVEMSSEPNSPGPNTETPNELWWNASNKMGITRSPPESPRGSFMSSGSSVRRNSCMTPEEMAKLARRRASLEKLQVEKVSPWMHLYDFTDSE